MSKIKETITALTDSENIGIVKVSRKENDCAGNDGLDVIFKFILKAFAIISVAAIVLYAEPSKLIALLIFSAFSFFVYCVMKD